MKTKEKKIRITLKIIVYISFAFFAILYSIIFINMYFPINKSYAKETYSETEEEVKISEANRIDLEEIIKENTNDGQTEKIKRKEEILEYLTQYRTNKEIPKGISYVVQEGRQGIQEIVVKEIYDKEGNMISEEQIGTNIVKSSANKIVEIGGASYSSNYTVKKGDTIYVASDILCLWSEASEENEESRKITTLRQGDEIKVIQVTQNWYQVTYQNLKGWVKSECTTYINKKSNQEQSGGTSSKTKSQLLSKLNFSMKLNEPSGLSIEQFKKVLTDNKDVNKIFANNSEYFYYIEKQYNINGLFVAAIGIHESNWGQSKIAINKNNLFGYGAYDSNPYNGAYSFSSYSESIDLIGRVLVKYYLNPAGTSIYGGEKALGTYYNGATLSGVNTRYATDKNWSNAVYSHMKYLYDKL